MNDQKSSLSIPSEWQEHFLIKRIDEEDIKITLEERNAIIKALNDGTRFVQIGKYTLMLNSIKSIDPVYEPYNIPKRPREDWQYITENGEMDRKLVNKDQIDLWDKLYGKKQIEK